MFAVPFFWSHIPEFAVCQRVVQFGGRFPFCQHKHVEGRLRDLEIKPKTITGIKGSIICDHLWPACLIMEPELQFRDFKCYFGRKLGQSVRGLFVMWLSEMINILEKLKYHHKHNSLTKLEHDCQNFYFPFCVHRRISKNFCTMMLKKRRQLSKINK